MKDFKYSDSMLLTEVVLFNSYRPEYMMITGRDQYDKVISDEVTLRVSDDKWTWFISEEGNKYIASTTNLEYYFYPEEENYYTNNLKEL